MTVSPMRTPLRRISNRLCRVAFDTVVPPTNTGSSLATGVSLPVRPTWMSIAFRSVVFSCAGYFCATAQRGSRDLKPSFSCRARSSTL